MRAKLPISAWGHDILHAAALIRIRPISYHEFSPLQLVHGQEPNISHLRIFGCAVYIPITPPHRTKMGPQRRFGIYVGYESPSIIKYLEPSIGDLFTVAQNVANENEDLEPMSMEECRHREDWPKWKEAIDCELKSLEKRKVF